MGWFKRILGAGGAREEKIQLPKEVTVNVIRLDKWVDEQANLCFERIKPDIEDLFLQLAHEKKELIGKLEKLKIAELHNPDISERERQLMEGNRETYISQHRQFVNMTVFSDNSTFNETSLFCTNFEEMLIKLAKSTARGHMVMNEFFSNHSIDINRSIKQMSNIISKMQDAMTDGNLAINELDMVKKVVHELKSKYKLLSEVKEELEIFNKKLDNSNYLKNKLNKNIDQMKQTPDYIEFEKSDGNKNEHMHELKEAEEDIQHIFSLVDRPMRKYERMIAENAGLLNDYINNPMKTLADDENLVILDVLQKMRKAIEEDKLVLKDKEKEKAVHRIAEITKDKLLSARSTYVEKKSLIRKIDVDLRNSRVMQDIDDVKYKIEHTDNQIHILRDKIDKAEKTKEKIDLELLKSVVQDKIKESLGIDITILMQTREDQVRQDAKA